MKKQDIRNIYTQKVTELLNQGYTIFSSSGGHLVSPPFLLKSVFLRG